MALTREQHLKISKSCADEFIKAGDFDGAVQLFISDLGKHDETKSLANPNFYAAGRACKDAASCREWIASVS